MKVQIKGPWVNILELVNKVFSNESSMIYEFLL